MMEYQWTSGTKNFELPKYIRETVFMQEQGFDNEFDIIDGTALHLVLKIDGQPAGCGRLFRKEESFFTLGRIALLPAFRGLGLGRVMMQRLEAKAARLGATAVGLSAQSHAAGFYRKVGYEPQGDEYLDEGCPHIWMVKKLPTLALQQQWIAPGGNLLPALKVRRMVFGAEFGYCEGRDALDETSHTLLLTQDGEPVGCGRIAPLADGTFKLGKIALLPKLRGCGAGARIMENLEFKALELGADRVFLWAQLVAKKFYHIQGYHPKGDEFAVEDKPHVVMHKQL